MVVRTIPAAALAFAVLMVGSGAPTSATASDETAERVSAHLYARGTVKILEAALCARACIKNSGNGHTLTGIRAVREGDEYTFTSVPYDTYVTAVLYEVFDDDGNPMQTGATYVRDHRSGNATIVSAFEDGSRLRVRSDRLELGSRWIRFVERPVPPPKPPLVHVVPVAGGSLGGTARFVYKASRLTPEVVVVQRAYGCRNKVIARKRITGRTGTYRYYVEIELKRAQRRTKVETTIRQPGRKTVHQATVWGPIPGARC